MRRTFGGPLRAAGQITPAAAGDEHVEQGIDDLAKGRMRHAPAALYRFWGKDVGKELPFQIAQALESSSHGALLLRSRALYHSTRISGINSISFYLLRVPNETGEGLANRSAH